MTSGTGVNDAPDDVLSPSTHEVTETLQQGQEGAYGYLLARGGLFEQKLNAAGVDAFSRVFVSMTEFNPNDNNKPFLGGAVMTVHNVVPQDGGVVTIRANAGVPNTVNIKISLFYYNGV
ncbi:hypothetical protein ACFVQ4_12650 [Streptomyces laurentii]|uniref:hypothetical protein n=1 Tax=Streptomyces laurentii TaxID=39478 RepID=UPI003683E5B8